MKEDITTFSNVIEKLDFDELLSLLQQINKEKYALHYKLLKRRINFLVISSPELYSKYIRLLSYSEVERLLNKTDVERYPEHYKILVERYNELIDTGQMSEESNDIVFDITDEIDKLQKNDSSSIDKVILSSKTKYGSGLWFGIATSILVLILIQLHSSFLYLFNINVEEKPELFFFQNIIQIIVYLIIFYIMSFSLRRSDISFKDIGFSSDKLIPGIGLGILAYLPLGLIILVIKTIFGHTDLIIIEESYALIFIYGFTLLILAPFIEELFFRGYLFNILEKIIGDNLLSYLVNAFIFAFAHLTIYEMLFDFKIQPFIFILGFISVYLYSKTKSLIPSITLHLLNNLLIFVYEYMA